MPTKYHNPSDSQSAHAVKDGVLIATPDRLAFIVSVFSEIDPALRKRIATAINLAGNRSMSALPTFLQPIVLYALTQDFETPWGYHPFHAVPEVSIKAIGDKSLDLEKRVKIAKIMLKHEDKSILAWVKLTIRESMPHEAQVKLGLATESVATVAPDPTIALRKQAESLGLDPDAFVLAQETGANYADALKEVKASRKPAKKSLKDLTPADAK